MKALWIQLPLAPFVTSWLATGVGIGSGPPGDVGRRAVRTSTPVSVTSKVCSAKPSARQINPVKAIRPTELCRPLAIQRDTRPVVRPCLIPIRPKVNHRLYCEAHARLRCSSLLVLRIMRYVWRTMEKLIDAMPTIRPDNTQVLALCKLLDDIAGISESHARLY